MSFLDKGMSGTTLALVAGGAVLFAALASLPGGIGNLQSTPRDWSDLGGGGSSGGIGGGDPVSQLLAAVSKTHDVVGAPTAGGTGTIVKGIIGSTGSGTGTSGSGSGTSSGSGASEGPPAGGTGGSEGPPASGSGGASEGPPGSSSSYITPGGRYAL